MKRQSNNHLWMLFAAIGVAVFLSSCSDSSSGPRMVSYRVMVTNLTNNQPLSPVGIVLHTSGYMAWETGEPAGQELELLAEGGDAGEFLDVAGNHAAVVDTAAGTAAIGPGAGESVEFEISSQTDLRISFATMLVNTNDAFRGHAKIKIHNVGPTVSH